MLAGWPTPERYAHWASELRSPNSNLEPATGVSRRCVRRPRHIDVCAVRRMDVTSEYPSASDGGVGGRQSSHPPRLSRRVIAGILNKSQIPA